MNVNVVLYALCVLLAIGGSSVAKVEGSVVGDIIVACDDSISSLAAIKANYRITWEKKNLTQRRQIIRSGSMWKLVEWDRGIVLSFDGTSMYRLHFDPNSNSLADAMANSATNVRIAREDREPLTVNVDPDMLIGNKLVQLELSLVDAMKEAESVVILEKVEGDQIRLLAKGIRKRSNPSIIANVEILFDPSRDFLPIECQTHIPESPNYVHRTKITDFQRVLDHATGRERWYPKSGELDQGSGGMIRIDVDEVALNPELPVEEFQVAMPDGATVVDSTSGVPNAFIKGDNDVMDRIIENNVQVARTMQQPKRSWLFIALTGGSLVAVVVIFCGSLASRNNIPKEKENV